MPTIKAISQRLFAAFTVGIVTGLREMVSHKLRSFLSLIGVMLGVGALVAMLTFVGGVDDFMKREMGSLAGRVGLHGTDRPEDLAEALEWSRSPGLRFKDLDFLEKLEQVGKVFRTIEKRQHMRFGRRHRRSRIVGTNQANLDAETNVVLKSGRFFNQSEYQKGTPVCVVSWEIEENLKRRKPGTNESGKMPDFLNFFGKRFRIIGIFELKNQKFRTWHYRSRIYIPLLAMQQYGSGFDADIHFSTIEMKNLEDLENEIAIVSHKLTQHHRSVEDFEFIIFEFLEEFKKILSNVKTLFGVIALASLLVGGLGIMNVMLSSLSERIREIGVRKALGASRRQILVQFLTETVILSLTGGSVGAFLGSLLAIFNEPIYKATGELVRPTLAPTHVLYVFWVVVLLGIVFGIYPALKAARLNPVEALRYE